MGWRKVERKIIQKNRQNTTNSTKLVAELNPNTWIIKIIMLNSSVFRIVKEIKYNYILLTRDISKTKSHRNETGKNWRKLYQENSMPNTAIVADT